MTREKQILALTCLLVILPILVTAECPNRNDIRPCICQDPTSILGPDIECGKIDNEGLANVVSHLRGWKIWSFFIKDSTLGSIPHDVFKGIKLRRLKIDNTTLSALTDGSDAFVGLEDQLEGLRIWDCVFKSKWDWSVLRNLKKLEKLSIWNSLHLETIGEDLVESSRSSVTSLTLNRNNISFVSDHAFDSFKDIESLSLHSNKIRNVKRTMLPNPALKLTQFIIRNNQIEEFPVDMFTNMPNLQSLDISKNNILVLDKKTFMPVWEKLETFRSSGNKLRCHCHMSWIAENRKPENLEGECASPPGLKGTHLAKLQSEDFMMCHS